MNLALTSQVALVSANILETALTPVFLLAGTASFLTVINARLSRVADRVNEIGDLIRSHQKVDNARRVQLRYLRFRTVALEVAVIAGMGAGILTCLAILSLLGGAIGRSGFQATLLYQFFSGAVFSLGIALIAFLIEMVAAVQSMLRQMAGDLRIRSKGSSDGTHTKGPSA